MRLKGLGFKVLAGLALISFLAMSGLILTLRMYLASTLEAQLLKRGVAIAHFLAEDSVNPILTRHLLALDLMLNEHRTHDRDLEYIYVLDRQQELVSHTFKGGFPSGLRAVNSVGADSHRISRIMLGEKRVLAISVPLMGGQLGWLHLGMSEQGIREEIGAVLLTVSGLITALFLVAATAMWVFMERVAVRPVRQLGEQVRLMGQGQFSVQAGVHSSDEIGMLATAFNEMGQHLNEMYSQMEERSSELVRLNEQLEQLATTDGLTGLFNHRHFYARLAEEIRRARRYRHSLSLIMGDIDHFKLYNDTRGHVAGDKVLKAIAGLLAEHARENDMVARYGGEEFVIILPETDLATALLVAERMRSMVESSPDLAGLSLQPDQPITMSFGVAQLDDVTDSAKGFVRLADGMLYQAKQNGRNRVEYRQV